MKLLLALSIALACALALPARSAQETQPPAADQTTTPTPAAAAQPAAPARVPAHPAFYPSRRQLQSWLDTGYSAFSTDMAHDDAFGVPGVARWFWLPSTVVVIGDAAAVVGMSCETPQLLAAYTAWRGTRSALPEAQITEAVYSELAQQAGYCRFVVVGLSKQPSRSLGFEYVLNVNGVRYGQPLIASPSEQPTSSSSSLLNRRDYLHLSVEVVERFDVEYLVDIQGATYNRTQARSSLGYERRASGRQLPAMTEYSHLVTEIVDFPLLRDDGAPLIPADASTIALEILAPDASYAVNVSLAGDDSYLTDEPPMTNPMAAVTMTGWQKPKIGTARYPRTPVVVRLEDMMKGKDFGNRSITVCQQDATIPTVLASFGSEPRPSELRSLVRRLVEEGQKALATGELTIVADVRGRVVLQGKFSATSKKVILTVP